MLISLQIYKEPRYVPQDLWYVPVAVVIDFLVLHVEIILSVQIDADAFYKIKAFMFSLNSYLIIYIPQSVKRPPGLAV